MTTLFWVIGGALILAVAGVAALEVWRDKCPHCGSRRIINDDEVDDRLHCLDCNSRWRP